VHDLAVMAGEILSVALRRVGQPVPDEATLRQFDRSATPPWRSRRIPLAERPPARSIAGSEGTSMR
jgi:hypothetical protein